MSKLFLRHGEVENKKDIFYGSLPGFKLRKKGEQQALSAANYIVKNFEIKYIYSSPLLRARQTAEPLAQILGIEVTVTNNLIEWGGIENWKGRTFSEFENSDEYRLYIKDPLTISNTEESYLEVYERVNKFCKDKHDCVFISHQDTIRSFTYYELDGKDFNSDKPEHCDIHEIINNKLKKHTHLV